MGSLYRRRDWTLLVWKRQRRVYRVDSERYGRMIIDFFFCPANEEHDLANMSFQQDGFICCRTPVNMALLGDKIPAVQFHVLTMSIGYWGHAIWHRWTVFFGKATETPYFFFLFNDRPKTTHLLYSQLAWNIIEKSKRAVTENLWQSGLPWIWSRSRKVVVTLAFYTKQLQISSSAAIN